MPNDLDFDTRRDLLAVVRATKATAIREGKGLLEEIANGTLEGAKEAKEAYDKYIGHLEKYDEALQDGMLNRPGWERLLERRKDELRLTVKAIGNEQLKSWLASFIDRSLGMLEAIGLGVGKAIGLPF